MSPASTNGPVYSFPVKALRRWAEQQLALERDAEGAVRADFRLEASTCGNVAFFVEYRVWLAPAADGFRVLRMGCAPALHDANHREQCASKAQGEDFFASLVPPPLIGLTLADALAWAPTTTPDGCLCAEPARAHKWRAVLQTIHFALHQLPV